MQYKISDNTGRSCIITLVPESAAEENAVNIAKDEFTLHHHYQQALYTISPYAVFIGLLNTDGKVNPALVEYDIARGIGE